MNSMDARIQAVAESTRSKQFDEIQSESVYLMGVADKALSDRIEAFGAIRRAVEIAREADRDWEMMRDYQAAAAAHDVRRAIRAAIGSPKA